MSVAWGIHTPDLTEGKLLPGKVPELVIQQVVRASDLVSLIGRHCKLKKRGKKFWGLCPFHKEKTPSFSVDPEQGLYYCFGCKEGGNIFTFLEKVEGLGFSEALELLARDAGIDLSQYRGQEGPSKGQLDRLREVLELAAAYYAKCFEKGGGEAGQYVKARQITDESAARWRLGYSPDGWDHFLRFASGRGYEAPLLEAAGLVLPRAGAEGHYDRFRNRLMFPVGDRNGRTIAFGARALSSEEQSKYLNSPEGPLFHKGRCFYGFAEAREAIRQGKTAVIVEGYTDVIMAHQFGVTHVMAVLGTALTEDHARTLSRMCERVVLMFDSDEAGQKSAARSTEVLLGEDLDVRVGGLPSGRDPCEFLLEEGAEEFQRRLDESEDFFEFALSRARQAPDTETVTGRSKAFQSLAELALRVPNEARRDMLIRRAAREVGVSEGSAFAYVERAWSQERRPALARGDEPEGTAGLSAELSVPSDLLGLLLVNPELQRRACRELDTAGLHDGRDRAALERLLERCRKDGPVQGGQFVHSLADAELVASASRAIAEEQRRQQAISGLGPDERYEGYLEYLTQQERRLRKQELLRTTAAPTPTTTTEAPQEPEADEDEMLREYMQRRLEEDRKSARINPRRGAQ